MDSATTTAKNNLRKQDLRKALLESIAEKAFWSYDLTRVKANIDDEKLIEKVLLYGSDDERARLCEIFSLKEIQKIWEEKLVIQEPRLHDLNLKLAGKFFQIARAEEYIQLAYAKYNLYDQFR